MADAFSAGGNTPTTFNLPSAITRNVTGWTLRILSGPCSPQVRRVVSSNGLTLVINEPWFDDGTGNPVPTTASSFELYQLVEVKTDYGLPDTHDQFIFDAVVDANGDPLFCVYLFGTFDLANNLQNEPDMVRWVFDESELGFLGENQAPIVGLRQLTPVEQVQFMNPQTGLPYPSDGYVIVEITGRDPVDGLTGVVIEYRRRTGTVGTITSATATTVTDTSQNWITNQWVNYKIELLDGPEKGENEPIGSNSANTLLLSEGFGTLPQFGNLFEIAWVTNIPAATDVRVLDNPQGTRSRFVVVPRSGLDPLNPTGSQTSQNYLLVRCHDKDGLYSATIAFVPDFDNTPEIPTVEARLDVLANRQFIDGSVDDDCQSIKWWLEGPRLNAGDPTVDAPNTTGTPASPLTDLSQRKDFEFDFAHLDGQRLDLHILPYAQPFQQGEVGVEYVKELARPPRTSLIWDPRDLLGDLSAIWVRLNFFMHPPAAVVATQSGVSLSGTTLTLMNNDPDLAPVSLDPHAYTPDPNEYKQYFVRLYNAPTLVGDTLLPILSNEAGTLEIPVPPDPAYIGAGIKWEIRDGATFYRVIGATDSITPFQLVFNPVFFKREVNDPSYVEYYSVLTGVPAEHVHSTVFDPDDLPSIHDLQLSNDGDVILVQIVGPDDDTKRWSPYARKDNPPIPGEDPPDPAPGSDFLTAYQPPGSTADVPNVLGQLDPQYIRWEGPVRAQDEFSFNAGPGLWYITACPLNGYGQVGVCLTKTLNISSDDGGGGGGGGGGSGAITGLAAVMKDPEMGSLGLGVDGGDAWNALIWNHTSLLSSPQTDFTVKIYVRTEGGTNTELTNGMTRLPWQDALAGPDMVGLYNQARTADIDQPGLTADGRSYNLMGSWLHNVGLRAVPIVRRGEITTALGTFVTVTYETPPGAIKQVWTYTVELYKNGQLVAPYQASITGYVKIGSGTGAGPRFATDPIVTVANSGACSGTTASPPMQFQVAWQLVAGTESSQYTVLVDGSDDNGASWHPLGSYSAGSTTGSVTGNEWSNRVAAGSQKSRTEQAITQKYFTNTTSIPPVPTLTPGVLRTGTVAGTGLDPVIYQQFWVRGAHVVVQQIQATWSVPSGFSTITQSGALTPGIDYSVPYTDVLADFGTTAVLQVNSKKVLMPWGSRVTATYTSLSVTYMADPVLGGSQTRTYQFRVRSISGSTVSDTRTVTLQQASGTCI